MLKRSMEKLKGLNVALCQMKVEPGRPDLNAVYIIKEIEKAKARGADIAVFPELCTTGYIVGDIFEDDYFIEDALFWNRKIIEATRNGLAVVFGTVTVSAGQKGEDGRQRKHNTVVTAQNGQLLLARPKTLQPDYRFFNDDKHFYSFRKIAQEQGKGPQELLTPVAVQTSLGNIMLGTIVCEDMWHKDYHLNPAKILTDNGAELIINVSASPWTWQKNRKRHQIVKELVEECKVPFVYVNNTGCQNTGKNIITFDGSSTVYDDNGDIVFGIAPYEQGTHDFKFAKDLKPVEVKPQDDTEELYNAMLYATRYMTPPDKKVLVGLSGGIDSAVVCALLVDALGKERVIAVNMPMGQLNSQETKDMARIIAQNLDVTYQVAPIAKIVETTCGAYQLAMPFGIVEDQHSLTYENMQPRARKDVLAAEAQEFNGFFVCCSNKTEIAFGYGTIYGDIAGYFAPLGDVVKREIRQIAAYQNKVRFKREVISEGCINQTPTAELKPGQKDPFDYGDLNRRGYHDEMIRAYTEFRKNPEWFLEMYLSNRLEAELLLEPGTLARLFPNPKDFVNDLRHWWIMFNKSFFKRVQCPPIPIFSKRAFGRDFEESMMQPHFTQRFLDLESRIKRRIAVFGGTFNPPGMNHDLIVRKLSEIFDLVLVVPCGIREDKPSTAIANPSHRKIMARLAFDGILKVQCDFYDLDNNVFTPTYLLQERYGKQYPDDEIWFAIGSDLLSEIRRSWKNGEQVWQNLKFVVMVQPDKRQELSELPPCSQTIEVNIVERSTVLRDKISRGEPIDDFITPAVAEYIRQQGLYKLV